MKNLKTYITEYLVKGHTSERKPLSSIDDTIDFIIDNTPLSFNVKQYSGGQITINGLILRTDNGNPHHWVYAYQYFYNNPNKTREDYIDYIHSFKNPCQGHSKGFIEKYINSLITYNILDVGYTGEINVKLPEDWKL